MPAAKHSLLIAWIIALLATGTSITLSEVFHLVPCTLCWYQRIVMFPLVIILAVGVLKRDQGAADYALPLAGLGALIAGYHSLLQWGLVHETLSPCVATVPCSVAQIHWLGFITIPFMSFLAFGAITISLMAYRRTSRLTA